MEMANRLFFRLYQCANMLHKTGSRAVGAEGLTTQQWAVLGALSREQAAHGMSVGSLARYLMVSRQNLSGLIGRMERDGVKVDRAVLRDLSAEFNTQIAALEDRICGEAGCKFTIGSPQQLGDILFNQ